MMPQVPSSNPATTGTTPTVSTNLDPRDFYFQGISPLGVETDRVVVTSRRRFTTEEGKVERVDA